MVEPSDESIVAAVVAALSSHGPLLEDELADVVAAGGLDLGPDAADLIEGVLEDYPGILQLEDERWLWLPALLEGRVFTHRLSEVEAAHDMVFVDADVAPLSMVTELPAYQHLTDGSPVADVSPLIDGDVFAERGVPADAVDPEGALLFVPGRFAGLGVGAGDLVGLRVTPDGLDLIALGGQVTDHINPLIAARLAEDPGEPAELHDTIWTLCADHDELFREPAVPLRESLSAAGLIQEGDWIAPAGFDFAARRVERAIDRITSQYEVDDDEALAIVATTRLVGRVRQMIELVAGDPGERDEDELSARIERLLGRAAPTGDRTGPDLESPTEDQETISAVLALLAEPAVADAVRIETEMLGRPGAAALGLFAESVESMAPRPARPALRWLRAVAHDRLGEVEQAEKALLAAESLDPSWPVTLVWLARYASDRGDAERGLTLLRRAQVPPDHVLIGILEKFKPAPRPELGRNQPCWCGSGRKYKVCHLNREQLPLAERADWLYEKACADLMTGPADPLLLDTAAARAQHRAGSDSLLKAMEDAIVIDAVLFEGGVFAEFVARRGALLPDDELLLAQQWLLIDRSVHEVVAVRRGRGLTTRDVRTGDVHEVQERTASKQVRPGQLFCGRIVPAGPTMQIFGGLEPVALHERDALIALLDDDPDPVELVTALSRRFAPPRLRNTEGESMTLCEATLRIADPAALTDALDREYDRRDDRPDDHPGWFEHVVTHGMERIRASLALDGDELHVEANSRARFDRVLDVVRRLDPSATVLDESREPAGDLASMQRLAGRAPATTPPPGILDPATDPALAAALAEFIVQQEQAWLDDSIPALAGYTPRQCAADPTRRPDLIRLLDSFPEPDGDPGMMSPARLRAALGLD